MEISVNVEIDCPKSKVWTAITDIQNCEKMISAIIKLNVLHQPEEGLIGLKWTETRKLFGKESSETMWITDCRDEEYYCTRAENCGAIYITKMALSEISNKTILSMSFSGTSDSIFVKLISAIMGMFIKKPTIKMLQQDLDEIKNFVEKNNN